MNRPHRVVPLLFATLTLAACQPQATPAVPASTPTPTTVTAPDATSEPAAPAEERLRGQLVVGKDGYGITLCGEQTQRITALSPAAESFVEAFLKQGPREFFVDAWGTAHTDTGRSLSRIELAYVDGPGCNEAPTPFVFKAHGTEPFWSLTASGGAMTFEQPDAPAITVAFSGFAEQGDTRQAEVSSDNTTIAVTLTHTPCNDGMSDHLYAWTAQATINGKSWKGCAYSGE